MQNFPICGATVFKSRWLYYLVEDMSLNPDQTKLKDPPNLQIGSRLMGKGRGMRKTDTCSGRT
jgi:hypothetical protein